MSIPVILELLAREDPSVKRTLADIGNLARDTFSGIKGDLLPPGTAEKTKLAAALLRDMREQTVLVSGELSSVRDRLNEVAKSPGLGSQAASYQAIQSELKRIGAASEDVRRVNPQLEASYKTLTQSAEDGLKRVAERASNLAQMGQLITGAFAGVGTLFGGMAVGALAVAGNFEALKAKLVSVTGSVEEANKKFEFAREFAASTPFDVEGIVAATAIIEGFKLKSEELLPVAANLASAMGTDLKDATLALSKAASGSADGFQVLKDTYAITNKQLGENGAVVNKVSGELSHLEKDVNKNKEALIKLINTKFGDAIARQSATLQGAFSNVGDAAKNLTASFGENLIPIATLGAKALSSMLNTVNSIPGPLKALGAAGLVLVGGLAGLGAVAAGSITALLMLQAQLASIAGTSELAATGLGLVSGGLGWLTSAASTASTAMLALAANPVVLALLAIGAAAGIASLAINSYEQEQIKAGNAIAKSTRDFVEQQNAIKAGVRILNEANAGTGKVLTLAGTSADHIRQISEALQSADPGKFAQAMDKAGVSTQYFKDNLSNATGKIEANKTLIEGYRQELEALKEEQAGTFAISLVTDEQNAKIEELTKKIQVLGLNIGKSQELKLLSAGALDQVDKLTTSLQPLIDQTKALTTFLDLSKSVNTAQALTVALGDANAQIETNSKTAEIGSKNLDVLLQKLRDIKPGPNADILRNGIIAQIKAIQDRDSIEKQMADNRSTAEKAEADKFEKAFERKKLLGKTSLQDELGFIKERLDAVKAGSDEELSLLGKKVELEKAIKEKAKADNEKRLTAITAAAENAVNSAKIGNTEGTDAAKTALEAINATIASQIANASNTGQKLVAVESGMLAIQRQRRAGMIEEVAAQTQLNQLANQKAQIERAISEEKVRQATQIASLELANAEQELQILEARKAAGENLDKEILAQRKKIFEEKLAQIEAERVAAVDAKKGEADAIEAINKQAELKTTSVINAETLRREQELNKQTDAQDKALTKQENRLAQSQRKGSNSPLMTMAEAFGDGAFSLGGGLGLDEPLRKMAQPVRKVVDFAKTKAGVLKDAGGGPGDTLANSINAAERAKKNPLNGPRPKDGALETASMASAGVTNYNTSIYVNGAKLEADKSGIKGIVKESIREVASEAKFRGK